MCLSGKIFRRGVFPPKRFPEEVFSDKLVKPKVLQVVCNFNFNMYIYKHTSRLHTS